MLAVPMVSTTKHALCNSTDSLFLCHLKQPTASLRLTSSWSALIILSLSHPGESLRRLENFELPISQKAKNINGGDKGSDLCVLCFKFIFRVTELFPVSFPLRFKASGVVTEICWVKAAAGEKKKGCLRFLHRLPPPVRHRPPQPQNSFSLIITWLKAKKKKKRHWFVLRN